MKIKNRTLDIFNLSFLDVISCAFGALILILLLVKPGLEETKSELNIEDFEKVVLEISQTKKKINLIKTNINNSKNDIDKINKENFSTIKSIESLKKDLANLSVKSESIVNSNKSLEEVENTLLEAKQSINERSSKDDEVGGIAVDSDYVVFIIDTSGSMKMIWDKVMKKVQHILDIHPKVSGFQIMNDNGIHLIEAYANKWIPDTPSRRGNVIKILANWNSASNSSPIEGLEVALKKYSKKGNKTSIYIFGDDYSGSSYTEVFKKLNKLNSINKDNIRINGIGFFSQHTTMRFPTLMRAVAENYRGSFIGLPF